MNQHQQQLIQATVNAFAHTMNINDTIRAQAEAELEKFKAIEGYSQVLLRILASNEVAKDIKIGASCFLKNMVVQKWRGSTEDNVPTMNDIDAQFVKDNLLEALIHTEGPVKSQLQHMIEIIANRDFPEKWPLLLERSIEYITSKNDQLVLNGIIGLQLGIKKFQFVPSGEKRLPSITIFERVIPLLLQIMDTLAGAPADNVNASIMQRKISKIFLYAITFDIPPIVVQEPIFTKWMNHLYRMLAIPLPSIDNMDQVVKSPFWLLKNTIARVFHTLLIKSGKPRKDDLETKRQLAKLYMTGGYAINTLKVYYDILQQRRAMPSNALFHQRYLQRLIEYFGTSIAYGKIFPTLKTILPTFIPEIIFPLISFTPNDVQLWDEDPHEYLRSQYDTFKDVYSPRNEAHSFIQYLVEKRGRQYFDSVIALCMQILQKYITNPDVSTRNFGEKYGALAILGHLSDYLKHIKIYSSQLEHMLIIHVFPELQSPLGYLRGQACWVFSQFYNITYTNNTNFSNALKLTLNLLGDQDLPVRVRAGTSICNLVRSKQGTDELRPILPQLLDCLFSLMGDIESDDLVTSIDSIIRRFKYEIGPYAISLTQRLTETFLRLSENEDDDSGMAANECFSALQTLSRALAEAESPELYLALEPIIVPFLQKVLVPDNLIYFEPALNVLTFFTFYPKKISPALWSLFPQIIHVFNDGAFDMIDSMVDPLDNYITYGTEHFLTGGPYLESILDIYKRVLTDTHMPAFEAGEVCKIMEAVLQRCRGRVDHIIPLVLECACGRLLNTNKDNEMSKELTVYLLEQVANCLYYNPVITVDALIRLNLVQPVFTKWFSCVKLFQRFYDKKLCVLGISSLLAITPTPAFVVGGFTHLMATNMEMMKYMLTIEKQIEREKAENGDEEDDFIIDDEEDDDDDEEHMLGLGEEDFSFMENADNEDVDDPEERQIDQLEQLTMYLDDGGDLEGDGAFEEAEFEGEDPEGDDDEEEQLFENEQGGSFETPIDDVDELEYLINSLKQLFTNSPQLEATLTQKQQLKIKKYIELIPIRKEKEAKQKKLDEEADAKRSALIQAKKLGKQ